MIDINTYILEDNKEYCELYKLINNDTPYLLLIEESNPSNICFRKIVVDNDVEYLEPLEKKEYDYIYEKYKEEFKDLLN